MESGSIGLETHPLADAEKLLHVPSGESMCSLLNATEVAGRKMLEAPPTKAKSHRPDVRSATASCNARADDEHAARKTPNV